MKKSLLLMAAAVAVTASANVMHTANFVTAFGEDQVSNEPLKVTTAVAPMKAPAVKADANDVAGSYILVTSNNYGTAHSNYNNKVQAAYEVVIEKAEDGSYVVSNLMYAFTRKPCPLTATFADGVLSIAPDQTFDTNASYGKVVLANIDDYTGETVVRKPITFAMDENGNFVQTSGSGLVRGIPEYATGEYTFTPYHSKAVVLKKANATFSGFDYDTDGGDNSYAVAVEENENGGTVYGIENGYVNYTVDANGGVKFAQDPIAYSPNYGQGSQYGFGMGVLTEVILDATDGKWKYYTDKTSATGLKVLGGTQTEDDENVTIVTKPLSVMAYLSAYGSLRFSGYVADAQDTSKGATISFSRGADPTAVTDLNVTKVNNVRKFIENGQVVIMKDGVKYNIAGQTIK